MEHGVDMALHRVGEQDGMRRDANMTARDGHRAQTREARLQFIEGDCSKILSIFTC